MLSFFTHNAWLMATGRWYRYGYACVNFGRPLSMRDYVIRERVDFSQLNDNDRHQAVEKVGRLLMSAISQVIPVLPVSLVATVFVRSGQQPLAEIDLKLRANELAYQLAASGAHVYVPRSDLDYSIVWGLRMLTLRHIVSVDNGLFSAVASERALLEYYANAIVPLVDAVSAAGRAA